MPAQAPVQSSTLILLLRSLLFSIGMLATTGMVALLVMLCFPLPLTQRYRVSQLWSRFNVWWLRITCRIDYQVSGAEHIPQHPVVVMAKHQSTWETMFLHQQLPPVAWVIKRELLWLPLFGWALELLHPIAINRQTGTSAIKQVIRQGMAHLRQGQWVVIFPEGTRTAPGARQRYGMSGAMLAVQSGCPVLPVAHNAGEYWPRRGFLKHPGTIQVVFGPLLDSDGGSPQALGRRVEDWIETTMTRISTIQVDAPVTDPPRR